MSRAGLVGERAGDGDPLLLAAGQLAGTLVGVVGEADQGEQQPTRSSRSRAAVLAQPHRDPDVLGGGEDGDQAEGLEDEADPVPAQRQQAVVTERRPGRCRPR